MLVGPRETTSGSLRFPERSADSGSRRAAAFSHTSFTRNAMESDVNPYRAPAEIPTTAERAATESERLELIVERYSNGIIARRWGATLIDTVVLFFFMMCCDAFLGNDLYQKLLPLVLLLIALYYPLLEGLEGGTVGKFVVGIRVVDYEGEIPGVMKAIVRTLTRVVEVNPFLCGGLPAGIVALMSRRKQRLGDMLAHTFVVYQDDLLRFHSNRAKQDTEHHKGGGSN